MEPNKNVEPQNEMPTNSTQEELNQQNETVDVNATQEEVSTTDAHEDVASNMNVKEETPTQEDAKAPEDVKSDAESSAMDALKQWWEHVDFSEKPLVALSEAGELLLKAGQFYGERVLDVLQTNSADATIKALVTKFEEVKHKVQEFAHDWNNSEDKMKLAGKFSLLKEYLHNAKALGNFDELIGSTKSWDNELKELSDKIKSVKAELVKQAEELKNSKVWKEATQQFKDLTEQWKTSGTLDKASHEPLEHRFQEAKNFFFDEKRKAHEELEKEMLSNLDLKLEVVEIAEHLAASENWKQTTEEFKKLMDDWKKIGPTLRDKNEELWNRFIAAKNIFFDKKKENYLHIKDEQEANLAEKLKLVEQAESMADSEDWNKTSDAYSHLMEAWKKIGRIPIEQAEEIWGRLSAAKDNFYNRKREHFEKIKVNLHDNLTQKIALVNRAEALQDSILWRETTEELTEMMTEWKKIGPVPREQSNKIWNQFLQARNHFFARKDADRDKRKARMEMHKQVRDKQAANTLIHLEEEVKDEQAKLADFQQALLDTSGPKAEQLKAHLITLIAATEKNIAKKTEKLAQLKAQHLQKNTEQASAASKDEVMNQEPNDEASAETETQDNSA